MDEPVKGKSAGQPDQLTAAVPAEGQAGEGAANEPRKITVPTSGGGAQRMNAVVQAVVRAALHKDAVPYAATEGWRGTVEGGSFTRKMMWLDVPGILNEGGIAVRTVQCGAFRERDNMREAVRDLVAGGIDRVMTVGGDGSLTGADELWTQQSGLLDELVDRGEVTREQVGAHLHLHLASVAGSIGSDLVGSDITVGIDPVLHRIIEAIDAVSSTAASHQRTSIVEMVGRRCDYLALVSAIAGGRDYMFIPELPPEEGWGG